MKIDKEYINRILYSSGDVFLPDKVKKFLEKDIIGSSKKTFYISWWSVIHIINGILFGWLYLYYSFPIRNFLLNMFIIHTLWELWQMIIGMANPMKLTGKSNLIDTIIDTLLFMGGSYTSYIIYNKVK
jgi:hypothetical protein